MNHAYATNLRARARAGGAGARGGRAAIAPGPCFGGIAATRAPRFFGFSLNGKHRTSWMNFSAFSITVLGARSCGVGGEVGLGGMGFGGPQAVASWR